MNIEGKSASFLSFSHEEGCDIFVLEMNTDIWESVSSVADLKSGIRWIPLDFVAFH